MSLVGGLFGILLGAAGAPALAGLAESLQENPGISDITTKEIRAVSWRPQRDSNPRCRRERPESWAGLDDGDG